MELQRQLHFRKNANTFLKGVGREEAGRNPAGLSKKAFFKVLSGAWNLMGWNFSKWKGCA